jgi:hypothetical protein
MDFSLSGLQTQASSWLTNFGPQILESGLKSAGLIKVAKPPTSNLTAAQVGAGQTGSISGLNSTSASSGMPAWLIPVVAVVALIGVFFAVKK